MATNYKVNYDDKRFTEVETDKKAAMSELEQTYGGMISKSDKYYNDQIKALDQWENKQTQLQKQQTDFAIEQIEQQKDQAQKDYEKEQSGAYLDWQKQSNKYGANAEQQAAQGMDGTGFSESSQVSMFNTYQMRVATAREVFNRAVLNYDNAIKDARLQGDAARAKIAFETLQKQLELSLEGFQYKNQLVIEKANKKTELDNTYHARYQDVLNQINTENALAEQVRQFDAKQAEEIRQFNKSYNLKVKEYEEGIRQFNAEIARLKAKDAKENALEIQKLELQKQQLAEEKRQFDIQSARTAASINKSSSGGSSSSSSSSSKSKKSKSAGTSAVSGVKNGKASSSSSSKLTVDMSSVNALAKQLGYKSLSPAQIDSLVASGKVVEYIENGKIKYMKKPSKQQLLTDPAFLPDSIKRNLGLK